MPRFMDFHEDLKLPAEAIAQIAEDLLDGHDEDAIRKHHAALGLPRGDVHRVDGLTSS
jgi:hypothetical protein